MRILVVLFTLCIFLAGFGCGPKASVRRLTEKGNLPTAGTAWEFRLGPGDVVEVIVWEDERLGREVLIRPDGAITLPLVGDIQAAGLTPMELQMAITARVADYASQPHVSVIVKQIVSYVLYVQGEVKAPGAYPVTAPTNLVQLISMAGGFTEWADPSKIKMLREVAGAAHLIIIDYHSVIGGKAPEWMAPLQSGDTVIVP